MNEIRKRNINSYVLKTFSFLEKFNYKVTSVEDLEVCYENDRMKIIIDHGYLDYVVSIEFREKDTGRRFSFGEARATFSPHFIPSVGNQPVTDSVLIQYLESIAPVIEKDFKGLLLGNKEDIERLERETAEPRRQYTLYYMYHPTITRSDRVWEQKDYEQALELYQKAVEGLNVTKKRRLDFLLKKLGKKSEQ